MATKIIKTSIDIAATPEQVWKVLTNFSEYPNWNPFLKSVTGDFIVGQQVNIQAGDMKFQPTVLAYELNKEIRWRGKLFFNGIFDGVHRFELVDNGDGNSTFKHEETFNGILVGLFSKKLDVETKAGFEAMNRKLKEIVEASVAQQRF